MSLPAALWLTAFLVAGQPEARVEMSDLRISLEGRRLSIGFELRNGLSDELYERIRTGLPSGFVFRFILFRDRQRWFDRELDEATLEVVAMYNAVSREYLVNFKHDGRLVDSRIARNRAELERVMTRFEALPIFNLGTVSPRRRLLVRARAELGSRTLLGFIPTRVTTDWMRSRKFRPPTEEP